MESAHKLQLVPLKQAKSVPVQTLTPQQQIAVACILEGDTNEEIAVKVGVHASTIIRWRKNKLFARALSREGKRVADTSLAMLRANVTYATEKLVGMLEEEKPSQTKFNAAMAIIKIVYENQMLEDIQNQVKELEAGANREP